MKKAEKNKYEKMSRDLEVEFSGSIENTKPLTASDRKWMKAALADTGPKIPVTIRLRKWQIERAKELAKKKNLRGYQTLIDQILTEALI